MGTYGFVASKPFFTHKNILFSSKVISKPFSYLARNSIIFKGFSPANFDIPYHAIFSFIIC
jgi:hypothetical protein